MKSSKPKVPPKVPFKPPITPARSKPTLINNSRDRDPVQVYCRLRPLDVPTQESCVTILNDTTVQVVPPETSQGYRSGTTKATQYTFTGVFDEKVPQKKIFHTVTLPLIEDLLHGKNSLLFAYGVTGSGKTHTMNGELHDGGIIPRCLDVIFNSIDHFQAKKHIFKPDKMNSFDIQSEADAQSDRQAEVQVSNKFKTPARRGAQENEGPRTTDATRISAIDEDQAYAVFVTFVEVYNNTVFDLLDDTPIDPLRPGKIQSKILREDQHHNMYVHAVTEIEVKSADEAADMLAKGQKRRRVAHTTLNAESSRSHSVFNIRVVQAPLDYQGANPEKVITVGQLSLVDLAGSERNNRTKTSGERLREAGSINNTLMTLRSCIEILRENQQNGTAKMVPYRDSKITHLFKSYFDGEGKVRMIVCVNPRADDYDETLSVMRFAEMAQEVQIARAIQPNIRVEATPRATPSALLPGRRKANRVLADAYGRLEQNGITNIRTEVPFDIDMVFSAARTAWPPLDLQSASDDRLINELIDYLQVRMREQANRREQQLKKCVEVRTLMSEMESELILKREEVLSLKAEVAAERARAQSFENRVLNAESANASLQKHLIEHQKYARLLEEEIREKEMQLNQGEIEIQNVKAKEKTKRQIEREKSKKELERYRQVEAQMQQQKERFMAMRDLIDAECMGVKAHGVGGTGSSNSDYSRTPSVNHTATPRPPRISDPKNQLLGTPSLRGPAVSTRKRRSRSADQWIDHRATNMMETDEHLQPSMPRARSITKLNPKDLLDPKKTKYSLTTQEQDSSGELETKVYKGDVLTSKGGGSQVVLQSVEILSHASPTSAAIKRQSDGRPKDVLSRIVDIENRCGQGIEGHIRPKKHCP